MIDTRNLRAQIEKIDTLPTIPSVLRRLLSVIEDPKVSLNDIGSFISNDPVLTSRVIKVVNSPIYGFPGRISSVNQALILLGLNVVKGMLLGVSVFEAMQKTMAGLWEHSIGCAVTARIIATKKGLGDVEEVSVAGILHDIGKVALGLKFQDDYKALIKKSIDKSRLLMDSEKELFFVTHAESGAWIGNRWNFPKNLLEIIEYHHKPQLSKNFPIQTAIIHLADILVRAKGFGFGGDYLIPTINPTAWQTLSLSDQDIKDILMEMEDSLTDTGEFSLDDD
ncbi:MAG: HDOD domain-containing protein [Thermodesulfovibrionales bacterium]